MWCGVGAFMGETVAVRLRKLHGWGNDFLVALDVDQPGGPLDTAEVGRRAPALCDRRYGVGADGLIHGGAPGAGSDADATMVLYNADGGRAEMSGNGIRCLAHAVVVAGGWRDEVVLDTDVGRRVLAVRRPAGGIEPVPDTVEIVAPMGTVDVGPQLPDAASALIAGRPYASLDVGNPHVVVAVDDLDEVDLVTFGGAIEAAVPGGINVEIMTSTSGGVRLRVWERGVGLTEACGTGACATASAARRWGLVGDSCTVAMPGGVATVILDGDEATLVGPSVFVGTVEVPDT